MIMSSYHSVDSYYVTEDLDLNVIVPVVQLLLIPVLKSVSATKESQWQHSST
jgi:hypothetical protein